MNALPGACRSGHRLASDGARRHQNDRGDRWKTIEEPLEPSKHSEKMKGKVVLVDCCTLWLTNYMTKEGLFSLDEISGLPKEDGGMLDAAERALRKLEAEVGGKIYYGSIQNMVAHKKKSKIFVFFCIRPNCSLTS